MASGGVPGKGGVEPELNRVGSTGRFGQPERPGGDALHLTLNILGGAHQVWFTWREGDDLQLGEGKDPDPELHGSWLRDDLLGGNDSMRGVHVGAISGGAWRQ